MKTPPSTSYGETEIAAVNVMATEPIGDIIGCDVYSKKKLFDFPVVLVNLVQPNDHVRNGLLPIVLFTAFTRVKIEDSSFTVKNAGAVRTLSSIPPFHTKKSTLLSSLSKLQVVRGEIKWLDSDSKVLS